MSHQGPRGGEIDAGLEDEGHSAKKLDPPLVGPNHEAVSVPTSERSQRDLAGQSAHHPLTASPCRNLTPTAQ